MANILCLDTATLACSVSVWQDDRHIAQIDRIEAGYAHAETLHVILDDVMNEAGLSYDQLDAIAVGQGPGSYTGLRIGVSAAKGLAYSKSIALLSIPTLQIMAAMASEHIAAEESGLIRPLLDARRMEVYSAGYDLALNELSSCRAFILDEEDDFSKDLDQGLVYFCGDGMAKCQDLLSTHEHARFIQDVYPSASRMGALAQAKFDQKDIEDTAYFEPFYLKEFLAKAPKKML